MASSINASTSGAGGVITTADNTGILNLQTAGTTAVTVDASQNVGIGTTSPAQKLNVVQNQNATTAIQIDNSNASTSARVGTIFNSDTTQIAAYATSSGYTGVSGWAGAGVMTVGSGSTNGMILNCEGQPIKFQISRTEAMRIDSSGNVLVNATAQIAGEKLQVSAGGSTINTAYFNFTTTDDRGNIICKHARATGATTGQQIAFLNAAGTNVGAVNSTTSATSYATSSDYRLKENVQPMVGALDKVAQLKPVTYTWKIDGKDGQGFIAHELQAVVPDAVVGEKDAVDEEGNPKYQGVDTSFLVATLTAAIQEQQTIINDLKARVTALEAK